MAERMAELMNVDAAWLNLVGELGFSMHGHTMTPELREAFDRLTTARAEAGLVSLGALAGFASFMQ